MVKNNYTALLYNISKNNLVCCTVEDSSLIMISTDCTEKLVNWLVEHKFYAEWDYYVIMHNGVFISGANELYGEDNKIACSVEEKALGEAIFNAAKSAEHKASLGKS